MQTTVRFINLLGLIGDVLLIGWLSWISRAVPSGIQIVITLIPILYCLVCFTTSYARERSGALLGVGVLVHFLAFLVVILIWVRGRTVPLTAAILFTVYALAWAAMFYQLPKQPPQEDLTKF